MSQSQNRHRSPSAKPSLTRSVARWALAVIVTAALATVISAQFVIAGLTHAGAQVSFGSRLAMSGKDLIGLAPLYAVFIAIALAVAFLASRLIARLMPGLRNVLYIGAGAVAMLVMLLLMERVFFGVPIIVGARTPFGLITQMLCGAAGGYIFSTTGQRKPA